MTPYLPSCKYATQGKSIKILSVIGSGGMGSIYLAKHMMLDKTVAPKTFKSYNLRQEAKLRFQREAQAIAKLNTP